MTAEDRANAVAEFGFTPRQARFLALVMRHAGVCLLRQYSTFAGIVHGQKTRAFFHKLVSRRYASADACRHNRGRLYHVHQFGPCAPVGPAFTGASGTTHPVKIERGLAHEGAQRCAEFSSSNRTTCTASRTPPSRARRSPITRGSG
jgi:hypothetical protein